MPYFDPPGYFRLQDRAFRMVFHGSARSAQTRRQEDSPEQAAIECPPPRLSAGAFQGRDERLAWARRHRYGARGFSLYLPGSSLR